MDDFADLVVRFVPPGGTNSDWNPVDEWGDYEWAHWLREHNKYTFLKAWNEAEITQYLTFDRWNYGIRLQRSKREKPWWFYTPTPIAVPFHASKVPNILFGGAAGGSKSHSARYDAYRHCFAIPDFRAIIMRRTFKELERNHLDNAKIECIRVNEYYGREVMKFTSDPPVIEFVNHGAAHVSKVIFGHCQNPGDEEAYLGDAYHAFYPDEMATFLRKQIIGVAGRLRSVRRRGFELQPRLAGTSNPGGAQTLWLNETYVDKDVVKCREHNPRYAPANYEFIQAMLYDNPYYMDADGTYTTYENRLFEYDPERRRQLLLGDWSALGGQFFPEFSKIRHCHELPIPEGSKIERWIDWGYTPHYGMCLWIAHLPNGRLYVFAEWKFNGATFRPRPLVAADVAKRIKEMTFDEIKQIVGPKIRISKSVADPSMGNADGHSGEDYAETFRKNGVSLIKGDNSRVLGWGRLRHWFNLAPDGMPWLVIHPSCVTTVRTIPALVRDEHDPDDIDTSGEDHPADTLRYGVMARPLPPSMMRTPRIIIPDTASALLASVVNVPQRSLGMVS